MENLLRRVFPFLAWWPMNGVQLRADLLAGLTVAMVLIPQSMAYAQLAGMPAYYGLYAAFLPVIIGALWGSSRQLQTGPVAVVALLTASALAPLAAPGSADYIALAILLALMVGVIQLTLGFLRMGEVVNLLSHPVILGFTNAAAIIIGLSQLNKLLGVSMERSDRFLVDILGVFQQIPDLHLPTLLFGVGALALMIGMKRYTPRLPGVLIAVVLTTVISWLINFEERGDVVGHVPAGLPSLTVPEVTWRDITSLLSIAIVIALVAFMEAIAIAKAMAAKTRARIDPNQELIGQGLANLSSGFSQAFPVSGSFSRSAVNLNAGAVTGLAAVFTGLLVAVTLLFLTGLLYHLPQAVLAAVIMLAVVGLVNFSALKHAWTTHRHDGVAALLTFVATLAFAPHLDIGILVGAAVAIILFLRRRMRPRTEILTQQEDGVLVGMDTHNLQPMSQHFVPVRFDGALIFVNVSYFEDMVLHVLERFPEAKAILLIGSSINEIDVSGEEKLRELAQRLEKIGVTLYLSGLKHQVVEVLERAHIHEVIPQEHFFGSKSQAIQVLKERYG